MAGPNSINGGYKFVFKTVLVGDSGVGKTEFRSKLCPPDDSDKDKDTSSSIYSTCRPTIGFEVRVRRMEVKGRKCKILIWDTPGRHKFRSIVPSTFRGASGIFLLYDITDLRTLYAISGWLDAIRNCASENATLVLLGNKCDVEDERMVPIRTGEAFAFAHGLKFLETSAMDGVNVERALYDMVDAMLTQSDPSVREKFEQKFVEASTMVKSVKCREHCVVQ